jgi:hypothetical protein
MQPDLVFELARVAREVLSYEQEVREDTGFLERGQVQDDLKDGSASLVLCVSSPDLREDRGSDGSDDGSSIPVVQVQESAEGAWAFDWGVFRSGIAVRFKEGCDQGVERLTLMVGGELLLGGVEYGSGFMVHRTIRVLMGT